MNLLTTQMEEMKMDALRKKVIKSQRKCVDESEYGMIFIF